MNAPTALPDLSHLWMPFTANRQFKANPRMLTAAKGMYYTTLDGRQLLDGTAGLWCVNAGHCRDEITQAIASQAGAMDYAPGFQLGHPLAFQAASAVAGLMPEPLDRVFFTNSGTEANLLALAAARGFTGRVKTMVMRGGYHGGVLTFATENNPVNVPIPLVFTDYNDAEAATRAILAEGDQLAAVLVEPMLGSGGCIPASREFLQALRDATRQTGAVLIFDEVMTSRHSAGGLQARHGIIPDMTTLGKYMAGGMSFGAFGGRRDIMAVFDGHRPGTLAHAGTFNNNVWSMAAGCVAMGEIFDAAAAEALYARGEALRLALEGVARRAGVAMQFTGLGSMVNVHFRAGPITGPYTATEAENKLRELFFFDMLAQGIYLARRGMAALSLPVTEADCARYVAAVEEFVAARKPLLGEAGQSVMTEGAQAPKV